MVRVKKNTLENRRGEIIKLLGFCDSCPSVQVRFKSGSVAWQKSAVIFPNLPKKKCPIHK